MFGKLIDAIKQWFGVIATPDPDTGETFLDQLVKAAKPAVEAFLHVDLDGDGIVSTLEDARKIATDFGVKKLVTLIDAIVPSLADPEEVKRLAVIARLIPTAASILASFGLKLKYKWLELAVSVAYSVITGIGASDKA